ncbi:MAG: hypothetical protein ABL308_12715 [Oceanicaulis sp.]
MRLSLTAAPDGTAVSLADMKAHLRWQTDSEDVLIEAAIVSAEASLEGRRGRLNRAFLTQTWELKLPRFWRGSLGLPFAPLQSVDAITYKTALGATATVDPAVYDVDADSEPGAITLNPGQSWPSDLADALDAVTIEFTAGYGGAASVPEPIKSAIKLIAADLFQHREAQTMGVDLKPNATVDRVLRSYLVYNPHAIRFA